MYFDHSPKVKQSAIRLYERGLTVREIVETIGISGTTLLRWCRASGVQRTVTASRHLKRQRRLDVAAQKYREGVNPTEIGEIVGVSATTVRWWARTMGWRRDVQLYRGHHSQSIQRRAVELYVEGRSSKYVAEVLGDGIDPHTVIAWVRKAGIKPRPCARQPKLDHAQADRLYKQLRSYSRVAKVLGCSQSGAFRAVQRALTERVRKEMQRARA